MCLCSFRVTWIRVPPEAALWVCCVALPDLASFFLPSHLSLTCTYSFFFICLINSKSPTSPPPSPPPPPPPLPSTINYLGYLDTYMSVQQMVVIHLYLSYEHQIPLSPPPSTINYLGYLGTYMSVQQMVVIHLYLSYKHQIPLSPSPTSLYNQLPGLLRHDVQHMVHSSHH